MLFWDKPVVTPAPLLDKPLDQSRLPSRFAQGRDLFAEPDSEDEALGLEELEDNRNAGIRSPELHPVDNSQTGLGSLSTIKKDFDGLQHGDLPDLDLDHHLQYHNDARGDARYYTQSQLRPVSGFSVLDVEDGFGRGYRNAARFVDSSVGAGNAASPIKLNSGGRVDPSMLGGGSGFVENAFTTIDCASGTDPVADSLTDTLQLLEGSTKITVTGDSSADSVTFDVVEANIDHGSIGGLGDDDHSQYALLLGRSGGQTFIGGTAANNPIRIQGTSHATAGPIELFDTNLQIGRVINTDPVLTFLHTGATGVFQWAGNDDAFLFSDEIKMSGTERILFRETDTSIHSPATGQLSIQVSGGTLLSLDSFTMAINADFDITGDITQVNSIKVTQPTNDMVIGGSGSSLTIQGQSSGASSSTLFFSQDGDGTDSVTFTFYGKGLPGAVTNRERLVVGYAASSLHMRIQSEAAGTGTLRPLVLFTGTQTSQLLLNIDGSVSLKHDNEELRFGAGDDAYIDYDGTNMTINPQNVGSGHLIIPSIKTTTGDPTGVEGKYVINTFDNNIQVFADGAWRSLASW